jgi:2-aminoadipate transaminase
MTQAEIRPADSTPVAHWVHQLKRSALQDMLVLVSQPGVLSFALGLPAAELFPAEAYARAMAQVLTTDPRALQYGPPFQSLKTHITALMKQRGVLCSEAQVFLTSGAQQGLSLLVRLLLNPGGVVLTETLTYTGFQQVLEPFQPRVVTVPTDPATGMEIDQVEARLARGPRPALLYAMSDGHNPLGVSLSPGKRRQLVDLARRYQVPIIEDDPYGFLQYESSSTPPLRALDDQWVFYVGSFSKILAPALRVGWLIVPESLVPALETIKEASDINMAPLTQRAIVAYLDTGHLAGHLEKLRGEYRARRDAMLSALRQHFPPQASWHTPASGMFIWVELPEGMQAGKLLERAIETERIAFLPGQAFGMHDDAWARRCLRLNFSNSRPEQILEGIARLGRLLAEF